MKSRNIVILFAPALQVLPPAVKEEKPDSIFLIYDEIYSSLQGLLGEGKRNC